MGQREYFGMLAGYHVWAHRRLLESLAPIGDMDYHADQGLFFRSIHRTLNHLLLVDLLWQGRLTGKPFPVSGLDQELVKERAVLAEEMLGAAEKLQSLVADLDDSQIVAVNAYVDTEGRRREFPRSLQLAHAFNHATHHRGQITAVITRLGVDCPVLDMPVFFTQHLSAF
ncbi:MAG TPA: DinB family protein [Gammaproteobacteria bacterium]|nr:DinB family protein [Gammaproteobacteria bacterium]